jgi:hypothetical protein
MPTINGLIYTTATVVTQSMSITGSFIGCLALASGSLTQTSPVDFTALKDFGGNNLVTSGIGGHIFLHPGTTLNMTITSASLHTTSAPVMFFS